MLTREEINIKLNVTLFPTSSSTVTSQLCSSPIHYVQQELDIIHALPTHMYLPASPLFLTASAHVACGNKLLGISSIEKGNHVDVPR